MAWHSNHSIFSHLGGSITELRQTTHYGHFDPLATEPPPLSPFKKHSRRHSLPSTSTLRGFSLCILRLPPHSAFQFHDPTLGWIVNEDENQTFDLLLPIFISFRISSEFGVTRWN
ncbi:hypothetical protein AVEN_70853-1 [Araneus ventricosus]|uniref:Uncharacterized protein n=1 Tax=Araneus ventricosus TaxID=182803 RepID=A0A4Y2U1I6_ARAVE|nr:hypothetical protein AVEN_70853-1 [Araneus ventricosus]